MPKNVKRILVFVMSIIIPLSLFSESTYPRVENPEVLSYLYDKAVYLSGFKAFDIREMPPIYIVTTSQLIAEVCPQDPQRCRSLAAVFDDLSYRILVRDDLQVTENFQPFNESFVIHEIVHYLQYRTFGAKIFKNCDEIYKTEELAYKIQDKYLSAEGEFFRASIALKYFYCDEGVASDDYTKSLAVWTQRQIKNSWPPSPVLD